MPFRVGAKNRRAAVFLCVLLIHAGFGALLSRTSRLRLLVGPVTQPFAIEVLPELSQVQPQRNRAENVFSKPASGPDHKRPTVPEASKAIINDEHEPSGAITTPPPIDWDLEAETVARNSVDKRLYRDLAGLTQAQMEWMKRNQMAPVPYNPLWDDGRRLDEPGVLWINDDCAIVHLLPVCRIKLGKRKVRDDLFKDMRRYLDERETDPLP
jgi:hypothetical protein